MTRVEPATGVRARSSDEDTLPAIPAARLLAMMDVAYGLQQFGLWPKTANADAVAAAFEGAVEILAEVAANRIRRGLFRRHVEKPEDLHFIPDEPARSGWFAVLSRQDPYLRCRYDGSIADFEDNEILLWSLYAASRTALRSPALADNAQQESRMLAGSMPLVEANANAGVTRFYRRLGTHRQPLHGLCRLVLEHAGLRFAGDDGGLPLTVDEPALFRAYVSGLLAGLSPNDRVKQRYSVDYSPGAGRMVRLDVHCFSDIKDRKSGRTAMIVGATADPPTSADFRRVADHATAAPPQDGAKGPVAVLVHPSMPSAMAGPTVAQIGGVTVHTVGFDLSRDLSEARRDLFKQIIPRSPA